MATIREHRRLTHATPRGVQVTRGLPRQRSQIVGRTRVDRKGHHAGNFPPPPPKRETSQIISPHKPNEMRTRENAPQSPQRIHSVSRAQTRLYISGNNPPSVCKMMR